MRLLSGEGSVALGTSNKGKNPMKIKELRARFLDDWLTSVAFVHHRRDDFQWIVDDGSDKEDVIIIYLRSVDLSPAWHVREKRPNIPLVLVADSRTNFQDDKICTKLAPAVMVLSSIGASFRELMPAIYAAVPGSIEP